MQIDQSDARDRGASNHQTEPSGALPAAVVGRMERAFGADFGRIRVHEDAHVARAGASAYARGDDLYFAPGRYDPPSPAGQELIGHELAHVVQQRQGRVAATAQMKLLPGGAVNTDEALEREADELGARAARGEVVASAGSTGATGTGSVAQCKITITEGDVELPDADAAYELVREAFSQVAPSTLKMILRKLDAENAGFANRGELDAAIGGVAEQLGGEIDPEGWAVLHRLKAKTFEQLMRDLHGPGVDDKAKEEEYIATDSRYQPAKFNSEGKNTHTWEGNKRWLETIVHKFSRAVLTDVPLSKDNLKRQSQGHRTNFSAYAREIAYLLLSGYLPFSDETSGGGLHTVAMVDVDRLPDHAAAAVRHGKKVDQVTLGGVSRDGQGYGTPRNMERPALGKAMRAFHAAGLPTTSSESFDQEVLDEQTSRTDPQEQVDGLALIGLARTILIEKHGRPQKQWNKAVSTNELLDEAKRRELVPQELSKKQLIAFVSENIAAIYATPEIRRDDQDEDDETEAPKQVVGVRNEDL